MPRFLANFLLFILIVAFSAIFRITNLDLIEFKADEAINLFLASRPLFGHPFPPGGTVSSIGLLNPPLLNYLLFPFVSLTLDPKMISFFIGLLNSLAIGGFFLIIKRYYGVSTAFVAATLLAFSPWSIIFSRKIWAQDFLFPFLVLLFFSLHKIVLEKKMIYWIVSVASSFYLLQLHQASIFFIFLITLFLLIQRVKVNFSSILVGFILGTLPLVPYLLYIIENISDPTVFLVAKARFSAQYFPAVFFRPLQITSQGNFHSLLGDDMLTFANNFPLIYNLRRFFYLEYLLLPLGIFLFWKNFPKLRLFVYATLGLPILYFLFHIEPFMHYFLVLLPLLFLFLTAGFAFLLQSKNSGLKFISWVVFTGLVGISFAFNLAFFNLLAKQKGVTGDYGAAFIVAEQNVKKRFGNYQNDKYYKEMILASYLPKNLMYGNLPVAKMVYSYKQTPVKLALLEKRLKEVPEDARIHNQLIAFYTTTLPTSEIIELLKKKSDELPGYQPVYEEVLKFWREQKVR